MKDLYFHATQYIRIKCPLWMTRQFYTSLYKWNRFIKRTLWKDEDDLQKINKSMQKSVNGANYQGVLAWKHCWWGSGVPSSPLISSADYLLNCLLLFEVRRWSMRLSVVSEDLFNEVVSFGFKRSGGHTMSILRTMQTWQWIEANFVTTYMSQCSINKYFWNLSGPLTDT